MAEIRKESSNTTATRHRADIKLGYACNNHCLFCVQGDKRNTIGSLPIEEVKEYLEQARKTSDEVVFTGGEITIRPDILDIIRFARKDLDYKVIQMQSNGRTFSSKRFCERVLEAGANEFALALHGHSPDLHDYLTQAPGSFRQTCKGIYNLTHSFNQTVITNSVVTKSNFRHLPDLATLLMDLGVSQYQFAFIHAAGSGGKNFDKVVPRKALVEPYLKKGLQVGIQAGISVMTEAYPYCFLKEYSQYAAEKVIPETSIFERSRFVEDYTKYRLTEGKKRGPNCHLCAMYAECEGPWYEYPDRFGWDEFIPIPATQKTLWNNYYLKYEEEIPWNATNYSLLLKNLLEEHHLLLDLGCGTGNLAIEAATQFPHKRITGIDYASYAIQLANEKSKKLKLKNIEFVSQDLFSFEPDQPFDVILDCQTLQGITDLDEYSRWISLKLLRKNGWYRLWIVDPSTSIKQSLEYQKGVCWHIAHLDKIIAQFNQYGLEKVNVSHQNLADGSIGWFLELIKT